ncbi:MAG TPA: PQQ-dependent dehydrogenase, methanol/ethanol family [Bryobacteraceae bacterium]|nr:PQQ-dependent dehydrogenase, methanol/ethanol family [Bryobacteraceae bacterium]
MNIRLLILPLAASTLAAQVTFDRLLHSDKEPQNWLSYSGGYQSQRHTTLKEITPANVKNLELQWAFQQRSLEKFEATPLVVDGVMYTTQAPSDVIALDATTGRVYWTFSANVKAESRTCCGRVNRGVAILGDNVFVGTIDGRLIALDAKTGKPVWKVQVAKPEAGYSLMHAPLVIKDKVIIGTAGGEFGIRGFIAAYDAATGKELWRFYTIPEPGEKNGNTWAGDSWKHGGASVWVTGSYDPELNLTYWGIGNPGPDWNGDKRAGDNLYSDCVIALDPDTGELKWYYQFTPHDDFDFDSVQVPVLANMQWQGRDRKVMLWGNRNGFFYVLDRTSGQYLLGKPFAKVTWTTGLDERGRPMRQANMEPTAEGTRIYPGNLGATNWYSPSYSPETGLFYLSVWDNYSSVYGKSESEYVEGRLYMGGAPRNVVPLLMQPAPTLTRREEEGYGAVRAIDPKTGERKWEFKMADVTDAGVLTTASGLLFSGGRDGNFYALDAKTGALLWKTQLGGPVAAGPMSYSINGRQFIAVNAGTTMYVFAVKQ